MIEECIELPSPDGTPDRTIDAVVYHSPEAGPQPGVIHLTDIGGMRPAKREMARRLAALGYTVLQPNAFYRTGRPPLFDFKPNFAEERTLKRFAELAKPLTPDAVERDANTWVDYLTRRPDVKPGGLAVVGYCFTGAIALRCAAARPDAIEAVASFHGGGLFSDAHTSPHLVLPKVKARLYFAHADNDRAMPPAAITQLDRALEDWGGRYQSELYAGALHGWTVPDSAVYDEAQAKRAFEKLSSLLSETLAK